MNRSIDYAKKNIRRTPYQAIAASMVMFMTFFALLTFSILALGFQSALQFFESKPQVIAFFKEGTTQRDVSALENALKQEPTVSNVKYVSKEDALAIYHEKNKDDPALLELVTPDILPSSLEISAKNPEDLSSLAQILKKEPAIDDVIVPEDVVQTLASVTRVIRVVGISTVGFLLIFAALVILMVTGFKIRLKRNEIEIMRLIGASPSFIRTPFILEGVFYGVTGALVAWVFSYTLIWYFTPFMQGFIKEIGFLPIDPILMLILLGISLIISIFVGMLGSYGAVRRYLKI